MGKKISLCRPKCGLTLGTQLTRPGQGLTIDRFPQDVLKKLPQGLAMLVLGPWQLDSNIKGGIELGGGAGRTQEVSEVTPSHPCLRYTPIPKEALHSQGLTMGREGEGSVAQ